MYRQIIIPNETQFTITFPTEFVGKQVELIAFTLTENETATEKDERDRADALAYLKNSKRIDLSNFKFDREEANER